MKNSITFLLALALIGCSTSRQATQRSVKFFKPLSAAEINKLHSKSTIDTPVKKEQPKLALQQKSVDIRVQPDVSHFKAESDSLRHVISRLEKNLLIAQNETLELRLKIANAAVDGGHLANKNLAAQPATIPDKPIQNNHPLSSDENALKPDQRNVIAGGDQRPSVSLTSIEKKLVPATQQYTQALNLFNQRQYSKSIELLEKVQNATTDKDLSVRSKYWMGESYFGLGEYARALRQFEMVEASGLQGKQADAYWMKGRCHEQMREFALARQCFELLIKQFPSNRLASLAHRKLESALYRKPNHVNEPDQTTV